MSNSNNGKNVILTIFRELLSEFVNVLFGNVWNKVGLSIILFGIALILILSPIIGVDGKQEDKPSSWYVFGGILILSSIYLILRRWKELKAKKTS